MYLSYNKSCKIVKRVKRWKESGDRPLFDSSVDYLYDYIDWRDLAAQALRAEMVYLWTRMPKRKVFLLHTHGEHFSHGARASGHRRSFERAADRLPHNMKKGASKWPRARTRARTRARARTKKRTASDYCSAPRAHQQICWCACLVYLLAAGSQMVNVVPRPTWLLTSIRPSCSTITL